MWIYSKLWPNCGWYYCHFFRNDWQRGPWDLHIHKRREREGGKVQRVVQIWSVMVQFNAGLGMILERTWKESQRCRAGGSANGNAFNVCGTWAGLAVIHGLLQLLIKERKFLRNIPHSRYGCNTSPIYKQKWLIHLHANWFREQHFHQTKTSGSQRGFFHEPSNPLTHSIGLLLNVCMGFNGIWSGTSTYAVENMR